MTKDDLTAAIAKTTLTSQRSSKFVLNLLLEAVIELIANDETITLEGFGTFERRYRAEKVSYAPSTGEQILHPAGYVPHFTPDRAFRRRVAEGDGFGVEPVGTESDRRVPVNA
jgi:DNA-binding protein HU-beta